MQWAFGVLHTHHSPQTIDPTLDDALIKRVKAAALVHVLGEKTLVSIDELARRSPATLFFVDSSSAPVEGFAPMVASPQVAAVIGQLAGIAAVDGQAELATQRKLAQRNARLAKHREQPELHLAFPAEMGHSVATDAPDAELVTTEKLAVRGFVGVGRNRCELEIRVENRPFVTLIRSDALPLYAVLDLDLKHVDEQFVGLPEVVTGKLIECVQRMLPALFAKIARERPRALAEPGFARALLYKWLASSTLEKLPKLRVVLCAAPAFKTIFDTRSSITDATQPNMILRTSAWSGEWLAPADGESPSAFEDGVLHLLEDDHQLSTIVEKIHLGSVVDVTGEVSKLQASRRMACGLIPTPALPHVPAELKRVLARLGEVGVRLGHGEIGLVAEAPSVLIHDHGTVRQCFDIDVSPAIQLAVEAPELLDDRATPVGLDLLGNVADQLARLRDLASRPARGASAELTKHAQELARALLREVIASGCEIPDPIKRSIRRGLLAKRIARSLVGALPVFELADGPWVTLDELDRQITQFGNVWVVTRPTNLRPLDDARAVFVMTPDELGLAAGNYAVIDAAGELDLDQQARRNRAKAPVASLETLGRGHFLAQVVMEGDGKTSPRGIVAPLLPHSAEQRGLFAHREMVPFSAMSDPCRWPTLAMIDDARLEPDRTWEQPRTGTLAWTEVTSRISSISERALTSLVPRPEGALAHIHVGPGVSLGPELICSKVQIRGGVWLNGAPRATQLEVFDAYGHHLHTPLQALGMGGTLYVHAPEGWHRGELLEELIPRFYGHLVTQLLGKSKLTTKPPSDVVAAHAAVALAIKAIAPAEVGPMLFGSIRPEPLDAKGLLRMFEDREPVSILPIGELEAELIAADAEGIVEDGSELSQALIACLASRVTRQRKANRRPPISPPTPTPTPTPTQIGLPAPRLAVPPPKPKPEVIHPIQNVLDAVHAQLIDDIAPQFGVRILDVASPIIGFSRALTFAGRDPRLHAISKALRANSPWAQLAIDALCAHAITVLDDAYSEVNQQTVRDVLADLLG